MTSLTTRAVPTYPETAAPATVNEFAAPAEIYASDLPDGGQLLTLMLVLLLALLVSGLLLQVL